MDLATELRIATEAARLAGKRILDDYAVWEPLQDAPASVSTETDRAAQEIILTHLHAYFPTDALCAEENTITLQKSRVEAPRRWVVDPIDGTRGFVLKNGEFSVMIGLIVSGQVVLGVVYEPAILRCTYASLGSGTWVVIGNEPPRRAYTTPVKRVAESILVQSHVKPGRRDPVVEALQPARVKETYSAGVKLAMVARGEADLYVNTYSRFADWDICAGHLLVEEAGGQVTEILGSPITYGKPGWVQNGGLVATNGLLHLEVIEKLRKGGVSV